MLTIEAAARAIRRNLRGIPLIARAGLVVFALAGIADLAAHIAALADAAEHAAHGAAAAEHTPAELSAHVAVFVGMVLILLGVVIDGARQTRLGRRIGHRSKGAS